MTTSCNNPSHVLQFLDLSFRKIKGKWSIFLEILFGCQILFFQRNIFVKEINNLFDVFLHHKLQIIDTIAASLTFCFGKIMPLKPSSLAFIQSGTFYRFTNLRLRESSPMMMYFFRFSAFIKSETAKIPMAIT